MKEDNDCLSSIAKAFSLLKLEIFSRKSKNKRKNYPFQPVRVRGDGGEEGKRVSRAFFCPRKLFPASRRNQDDGAN
ncbi:MAG: hypothetical protein II465_01460 [Bacteroidales bacterium]|nr:hypothetical protein [Bacteroidales bacterium]